MRKVSFISLVDSFKSFCLEFYGPTQGTVIFNRYQTYHEDIITAPVNLSEVGGLHERILGAVHIYCGIVQSAGDRIRKVRRYHDEETGHIIEKEMIAEIFDKKKYEIFRRKGDFSFVEHSEKIMVNQAFVEDIEFSQYIRNVTMEKRDQELSSLNPEVYNSLHRVSAFIEKKKPDVSSRKVFHTNVLVPCLPKFFKKDDILEDVFKTFLFKYYWMSFKGTED